LRCCFHVVFFILLAHYATIRFFLADIIAIIDDAIAALLTPPHDAVFALALFRHYS